MVLVGLKGIEPIADDILTVGCGNTEEEAIRDHDGQMQGSKIEAESEEAAISS